MAEPVVEQEVDSFPTLLLRREAARQAASDQRAEHKERLKRLRSERREEFEAARSAHREQLPDRQVVHLDRSNAQRQSHAHESMVYAVLLVPLDRVKIGVTTNCWGLLQQYRRVLPEAELVRRHPGDRQLEQQIHRALADYNVPHLTGRPSEVFDLGGDTTSIEVTLNALALAGATRPDLMTVH